MTVKTEVLEVRQYAAQYELLRAQVIGTPRDGSLGREARPPRGIGLALLLREGLPGWLRAVEPVLRAALASPAPESSACGVRPALERAALGIAVMTTLQSAQRLEVTTLLASLVLSTRHLAGLSPRAG